MNPKNLKNAVSERAVGQYKISIPTSLAIEYVTGIHEEKPEKIPPISKYKGVAINLSTLVRNFIGSVDPVSKVYLSAKACENYLYSEIQILQNTLNSHNAELLLYTVNYDSLKKLFPNALLKTPTSPNQKNEAAIIEDCIKLISEFDFDISHLSSPEKTEMDSNVLIMTHNAVDLLSNKKVNGAHLLESHTGTIKDRHEFGTKLGLGNHVEFIPYSRLTLQLFGDKANQFFSMAGKYKNPLIEHAKKHGWTKRTTDDRIRSSLNSFKDQEVRTLLKSLL